MSKKKARERNKKQRRRGEGAQRQEDRLVI